jgi:hypothetical protein
MQALALVIGIVVGVIAVLLHIAVWRDRVGRDRDRRPADPARGTGSGRR